MKVFQWWHDWLGVSPPTCCVRRPPAPQRAPPLEAPKPGPGGSAAGPLGSETATTPVEGKKKKNHQRRFANSFRWQKMRNSERCRSTIICGTKQQIKALSHFSPASAGDSKTNISPAVSLSHTNTHLNKEQKKQKQKSIWDTLIPIKNDLISAKIRQKTELNRSLIMEDVSTTEIMTAWVIEC